MANSSTYFAADTPENTASNLLNKSQSFFTYLRANAYLEKLNLMYRAYYGAYNTSIGTGHQIHFTGEQGELALMPVNHFRNIAQHIYTMITANRPVMEARAVNLDSKSQSQAYLANGILDYYMREKGLEEALKRAVEMSIVLGTGFVKMEWNATAGEEYDFDEESNEFQYEGEIEFCNPSPLDVIVDGTKESWDNDWVMVKTYKNRFDLMAKYPDQADRIKGMPSKNEWNNYKLGIWTNDDTDDICVYEFFHKKTEALPNGRYMLFLSTDCVLLDMAMPYRVIPIFRIAPSTILGTPYGYSPMFDLLPLQEAVNSLYSTILTNQNNLGVQNIYVPRGADININTLQGAMNIISGNAKPEPLNLTQTPKEVFEYLNMLIQAMETISGVNSVSRGNPEASLKSGTALALVQSMSLQFISGLQQSYVKLIEDSGTALIQVLKDFSNTPKLISLVGKNNRPYLKEFVGDDIKDINRIIVDVGNPLSHTIAGRVQMAEQLLQMHLLDSPDQYFQVINTGRLDAVYQGQMSELLLIQSENEKLLEGENPLTSPLDKHKLHIDEHKAVLSNPDLRNNPDLVKLTMDHIEQHLNALRNTDPALLQLIGEQPIPPLPQPGEPPPGPQGPPGMPPGPPGMPKGGPPMPPPGMGPQGPQNPNQPHRNGPHAGGRPMKKGPTVDTLRKNPFYFLLQAPNGTTANGGLMPNIPKPPKGPFHDLPVLASQVLPH